MVGQHLFHQMDDTDAEEIAGWHHDPPYDFYDWDADPEDLAELRDPEQRENVYFSVRDEKGGLVGFFQFEEEGGVVDIGLGLRPNLTGRGLGLGFLLSGLEFAGERFAPKRFTLAAAMFNGRAIQIYERAGFRRDEVFTHETNGGRHEFLRMWLDVTPRERGRRLVRRGRRSPGAGGR